MKIYLRELREKLNLTQEELAEKVGCHVNTVRRWELGYREPKVSDIKKLIKVLNCTELELLNGSSEQEFEVKIIMGVKNLTNVLGLEIDDNSFFYGIDDNKPQIHIGGKIGIATEEDRKKSLNELIQKFWKACWMYDHKDEAESHEAKS